MATSENTVPRTTGKTRQHPTQNEALAFEKSAPGKRAFEMFHIELHQTGFVTRARL